MGACLAAIPTAPSWARRSRPALSLVPKRCVPGVPALNAGHSKPSQPTLGRFLVRDPIGYQGGMNLYAYCGNNPLNCVDPSGLDERYPVYDPSAVRMRTLSGNAVDVRYTGADANRGPGDVNQLEQYYQKRYHGGATLVESATDPEIRWRNCFSFACQWTGLVKTNTQNAWVTEPGFLQILDDAIRAGAVEADWTPASKAAAGDLVIYFDANNVPTHAGVVLGEGRPYGEDPRSEHRGEPLVISDWADLGVYVHRANVVGPAITTPGYTVKYLHVLGRGK
ncbi:MAG: RHS repeat-associated core domain-containing protein [Vulcanimicrobiota bacterium]